MNSSNVWLLWMKTLLREYHDETFLNNRIISGNVLYSVLYNEVLYGNILQPILWVSTGSKGNNYKRIRCLHERFFQLEEGSTDTRVCLLYLL